MTASARYDTLEQLLDEHRPDGVDSEGHFSLNPARARELLKQFQLPEPGHYLIHVVSFLVGAGASLVSVTTSRSSIRVEAPGAQVDEQVLRSPFSVLLRSSVEPFRSELALGLNALLLENKAKATLGFEGLLATYTLNGIQVVDDPKQSDLTLSLGPRMPGDRELELLRQFFRYSPTPVKINGLSISGSGLTNDGIGIEVHLQNKNYPLNLPTNDDNRLSKEIKAPFSALLKIGRTTTQLRVLSLGRVFEQALPWSFFVPGWQIEVTLNSDQFRKDLSQQEILQDKRFQNLLHAVRLQCEKATQLLLTQIPAFPGSEDLVDDLVEYLYLNQRQAEALSFQRSLAQSYALKGSSLLKGRALYRLALMEERSGQTPTVAKTQFARDGLLRCSTHLVGEPQWSVLKAQMAFGNDLGGTFESVQRQAREPGLTSEIREYCYRWLVRFAPGEAQERIAYRVDLARELFESGRIAEALLQLEGTVSGPGGELLINNHRYHTRELALRGEIAAELGQTTRSIEYFGRLLKLLGDQHGQYSLKLGLTLVRLSVLLEHAGRKKQAKAYRDWSRRLYE